MKGRYGYWDEYHNRSLSCWGEGLSGREDQKGRVDGKSERFDV